jgi:putative NADPH-quinone reductase
MKKKKILVVLGHPYEESFNAAIFKTYVENLDEEQYEVRTLELGKLDFDPVLRMGYTHRMPHNDAIEQSQEYIKWADHITFIYPIWFSTMPSLLKGWLDRVIAPKFAYNMKGLGTIKHLAGRTAEIIVTCDSPWFAYRLWRRAPIRMMKTWILGMAGIKVKHMLLLPGVGKASDDKRKEYLAKAARRAITAKI